MEFSEVIKKRLTTLNYTNKKVSNENMNKIIESAIIAPSAKNRQPWRFYLLTDKQKNDIADKMENWINHTGLVTTVKRSANVIRQVGNCVLIYSDKWDSNHVDKIKNPQKLLNGEDIENMVIMHDYYFDRMKADILSVGAAVEHMILKATELGIDTTWLCDVLFIDDMINEYLGLKDKELICGVAFGYRNQNPIKKGRYKKEYLIIGEENERQKFCR